MTRHRAPRHAGGPVTGRTSSTRGGAAARRSPSRWPSSSAAGAGWSSRASRSSVVRASSTSSPRPAAGADRRRSASRVAIARATGWSSASPSGTRSTACSASRSARSSPGAPATPRTSTCPASCYSCGYARGAAGLGRRCASRWSAGSGRWSLAGGKSDWRDDPRLLRTFSWLTVLWARRLARQGGRAGAGSTCADQDDRARHRPARARLPAVRAAARAHRLGRPPGDPARPSRPRRRLSAA